MNPIRIILADNHGLVRQGLRALLDKETNIEVVGEAEDGRSAISLIGQLYPDIILMDISLPGLNGVDATQLITTHYKSTRVIILSMHTNDEYIMRAFRAGACGYVLKQDTKDELMLAILAVYRGHIFLTPQISQSIIQGYLSTGNINKTVSRLDQLTIREREILQLISEGYSSKDIAERLVISPKTVERHRANLMHKLEIHTSAGLVRFAIQSGLINLDG